MQTVLITGATEGIGRETARQLLSRGFRVLVHGRTLEKAQRVVAEFQRTQPGVAAEAVYADLARMPAVVALAGQISQQTPVLDGLIHNAGVYQPPAPADRGRLRGHAGGESPGAVSPDSAVVAVTARRTGRSDHHGQFDCR